MVAYFVLAVVGGLLGALFNQIVEKLSTTSRVHNNPHLNTIITLTPTRPNVYTGRTSTPPHLQRYCVAVRVLDTHSVLVHPCTLREERPPGSSDRHHVEGGILYP
jgi:hypothetical protein